MSTKAILAQELHPCFVGYTTRQDFWFVFYNHIESNQIVPSACPAGVTIIGNVLKYAFFVGYYKVDNNMTHDSCIANWEV